MASHEARWHRREAEHLALFVHAQPGAKRTEVQGLHGDALKIRVHAPALKDRANDALIEFVAQRLGIARRDVVIAGGARSREKKLLVPAACDPARLYSP